MKEIRFGSHTASPNTIGKAEFSTVLRPIFRSFTESSEGKWIARVQPDGGGERVPYLAQARACCPFLGAINSEWIHVRGHLEDGGEEERIRDSLGVGGRKGEERPRELPSFRNFVPKLLSRVIIG
jgi:hypothetical protein